MKVRILSDLHLEFANFDYNYANEDVVILAGDIHVGDKAIAWIKNSIKDLPVIYVLGNHEYYGHAYPELLDKIKKLAAGSPIHVLENDAVIIDQVKFCGSTLWSDFAILGNPKLAKLEAGQRMNDYHLIRKSSDNSIFKPDDSGLIHTQSLIWLKKVVKEDKTPHTVIITHHAPSLKSVSEQYKDHILTGAFVSDLEDFVLASAADLWIHGHVHDSFDYALGQCRVISNPRGYIPHQANPNFIADLILEI